MLSRHLQLFVQLTVVRHGCHEAGGWQRLCMNRTFTASRVVNVSCFLLLFPAMTSPANSNVYRERYPLLLLVQVMLVWA